jgi:rod shape-determining protein MreD
LRERKTTVRRTLTLFVTLIVLWAVIAQINHALAGFRVYLFAGGLFVAFAATTQPRRSGLIASILAGLMCDANAPVIFGTHMLLFVAAHVTLFHVRDRVPRDDSVSAIIVVLLTNLGLFLVFSFTQIPASPSPATIWPRLIVDLLCSQVFLALVTPWFFALQTRSLALARVPRDEAA